ncbi:pisatin demethylase [Paraphoma chrysanthemicola]|uniref:Pisatin demethylase n=1 Tax=Paraphoma chrysanthemicola TaxID=798071 RepID=A0A8K0RE94_9PLEO|nr:pisatin demethylase [Paraphoma chrysanthemicola]
MLRTQITEHFSPLIVFEFVIVGLTVYLLYNKLCTGLNHIPGPFWASFSDFYRLCIVWGRRPEQWHIQLHKKYGEVVRIGPKTVICSSNKAAKKIYALNAGFVKSEFYPVQRALAKGIPLVTLFTSTDEAFHAKLRRSVNNAYAMSSLVQFEPLVDSTITEFLRQLRIRNISQSGVDAIFDFGEWLQYFAFDVICELTFSKRMGFVDRGEDVENIISNLQCVLDYAAVIGQVPFLDRLLLKNPIRKMMSARGFIPGTPVAHFALKRIEETTSGGNNYADDSSSFYDAKPRRDFLSRFQEANVKDPNFISNERVLALTTANMIAGSDTTAISLRAIFYNLVCNPARLAKLHAELDGVWAQRDSQAGLLSWDELRELPYLSAVINESLRTHPAAGLPLERIVPADGVQIGDTAVPRGTNIGCNAWVLHLDDRVWGPQPEKWIPERWIDASDAQKSEMKNSLFTFGAGARTCIGKNVSYLEMYKLIPALLNDFDIELAYPDKEWKLHNAWFVKQSDFYVKLKSRR